MSTCEDVFWIYERNKNYYCDCVKLGKIDQCPEKNNNQCYCCFNELVNPITIGNQGTTCDIKRLTYITPGQECSICLSPVLKKSESYLTDCGHGFHKLCIFKAFEINWKNNGRTFNCPNCRCCLGWPTLPERYNHFSLEVNYIDKLEDFWNYYDYQLHSYCLNGHIEGTNKDCILCTNYRRYGKH
jgi:hypothetical protein